MTASLTNSAEEVLRQGCALLDSISEHSYVQPLPGSASGSIGAHYRHVLEHFVCLLEGIASGQINYDHRRREARIENSVLEARLVTETLIEDLREIPSEVLNRECLVTYTVAYGDSDAEGVKSTFAREVMFSVGHAIHHYAIIKLLCAGLDVRLPSEFGIAPSTLKHAASANRG
jgi:hypothetical protein